MAKLYGLFQASPIFAPAAGWTFELRMHEFLVRKQTIELLPVFGRKARVDILYDNYTASKARENPGNLQLAESENLPFVKAERLQKNHYCCPESRYLLTIDSLLLIHPPDEPPILMFKISRNRKDHHANPQGLHRMDNLKVPPDTRRYYVVVTPEGIRPRIKVSAKYLNGQRQQETSDEEILVSRDARMLADEDEDVLADEDEEVPADEGGEMSVDGNEGVLIEQLFQVFHYPVRMTELFASQEIGQSIITFVLDKYSRY